eukprot:m.30588 g.30588  ORF g.30588 m.30588 type:complete len:418 (-) comp5236_c0_seq2:4809-6062(-)
MEQPAGPPRALPSLISKLAHHLPDVRIRAFRNLKSKLEHGLLRLADLVHEVGLLVNLLEWFNFEVVDLQSEVLQLVLDLSQHPAAASTLIDIGGVEFFTQMRVHEQEMPWSATAARILERLLLLPTNAQQSPDTPQLPSMHELNSERNFQGARGASIAPFSATSEASSDLTRLPSRGPSNHPTPNWCQSSTATEPQSAHFVHISETSLVGSSPVPILETGTPRPRNEEILSPSLLEDDRGAEFGIQVSRPLGATLLSEEDDRILDSSELRLQSHDPNTVLQTVLFVDETLLDDYPCDVFFYQSAIIPRRLQNLLLQQQSVPRTCSRQRLQALLAGSGDAVQVHSVPQVAQPTRHASSSLFLAPNLPSRCWVFLHRFLARKHRYQSLPSQRLWLLQCGSSASRNRFCPPAAQWDKRPS